MNHEPALKKSTQVAVGGVSAALCLILMFMTGMIPFSSYLLPAAAGVVLVAVSAEMGVASALLVYVAVALLSLLIVPDQEAKLLFILFLGYYPMLKPYLERLPKLVAILAKLALFNVIILLFYYMTLYVLGIPDILDGWGDFGKYTGYVVAAIANFTFIMYDFLLSQVLYIYKNWLRKRLLRNLVP